MASDRQQLYLFIHLPKSAGSSFNKHCNKHFSQKNRLTISPQILEVANNDIKKIITQTKKYFKQLNPNKKKDLLYITGHNLPYGLHRLVSNQKKPFYFTFLRDPAQRITSLYNYYSQWYENDLDPQKNNNQLYNQILLINKRRPNFLKWYQQKFLPAKNKFPNPSCTTFYKKLGFLAPGKVTKKTAQKCWQKFSFVGLTESFDDDAAYLYHLLGINKFFVKQNISQKYFRLDQHPKIKALLKKDLATEYLLYDTAVNHRQSFIDQHPGYHQIVRNTHNKQRLLTPITQVVFNWPDNLHIISQTLRQILPGYGKLLNLARQLQQ